MMENGNIERLMTHLAFEKLYQEFVELKEKYNSLRSDFNKFKDETLNKIKPAKEEDEYLDTKQVLELLGISYKTLRKLEENGSINPIKVGIRRKKYSKKELIEFMKNQLS